MGYLPGVRCSTNWQATTKHIHDLWLVAIKHVRQQECMLIPNNAQLLVYLAIKVKRVKGPQYLHGKIQSRGGSMQAHTQVSRTCAQQQLTQLKPPPTTSNTPSPLPVWKTKNIKKIEINKVRGGSETAVEGF